MDASEPIACGAPRIGGRVATPELRCTALWGLAVLGLVCTPTLARAADGGLGFDATFRAFFRGGGVAPLIGPPTRTPRRAPSSEPVAGAQLQGGEADPKASSPVPSDSSVATPTTAEPDADADASAATPGGPRVIPRPNAAPVPDQAAAALEAAPAEDEPASGPSAAEMERALPSESGPPPSTQPLAPVETGPSRFVRGKSVPPFWIDRTWTTHRTRALTLPPFGFHRSGGANNPEKLAHFDLSLTIGWYSKRAQKRRYLAPAALFFGSFSERTSAWAAAALLMGYKRTGEQYNFGQFPFVWRWGNKQVKNLVVVPFHYHQKTPDSLRGFDAILFWYGHKNTTDADPLNDLRYFVGAPLFLQLTQGVTRTTVGLPFYVGGADKAKGLVHRSVFPFVHWQSREFGNRKELWTLLYLQRSDLARKRRTWAVPPLLSFQQDTPERALLSVTPLVWRSVDKIKGSTAWAAFPWVSYRDPDQRNRVLFPLYWQFDDLRTGARTAFVFPLGGGTRRPGGAWGMVLPPLLTVARHDPKGRSFQVVTPLFWRFRDRTAYAGQGSQQVVLPPLFVYNQQGPRRDVAALPLLSFFGRDATRRYQVLAPLLFGHVLETDRARWHDTWVAGPVYVKRTIPGWHAGLMPVAAFGRDDVLRYTVLPPLLFGDVTYVKEQRRLTISPLFARSKSPDQRTIGVLNLFWDVKRKGDERHSVLFPLFYRRQHADRVLTITPLGGGLRTKDRSTWMATPLLYGASDRSGPAAQRRRSFGLVPLVFYDRRPQDGGVARNLVAAPLFAFHRAPAEDLDMWSPLVWRTATRGEKPRKNLAVVPLYFRQRQPGGIDLDAGLALPFFYSRDRDRHTHTLIAGPFFHRLSRKSLHTGIVPLAWWMDSSTQRRLVSLPIVVHFKNKQTLEHTTIAVPFWFDRRRANGRRTWVALPFVIGTKGQHNFTRFSLLPPGFVDAHRLGKNFRFTGFAPLLFRHQKCGFREEDDDRCRYTLWGSFPLFLAGRDGLGRRTHSALGLYYFDKDKGGTRFYTLLGGANVRPKERLTWYALNVGRTVTRTHATTVVFPLFFRKAHRSEDRSTTVVLPPLYVGRRKEEYRWFEAGLLFWNFRRPHKVTTAVAPPIFFTSHAYAEKRMTWTIPLFLRSNNWAKDRSLTIVPPGLVVQRRNGEDQSWVQFPLLWHIERGENSGTVGAALWWDVRRKKTITQVIPALMVRHVNKAGDALNVVGPGLGWWTRKHGKAEGLHWRALFGLIGGGNEAGKRYFSLFGGRIALKPRPVWESRRGKLRAEKQRRAAEAAAAKQETAPTRPAAPGRSLVPVETKPAPAKPGNGPATGPATPPATPPAGASTAAPVPAETSPVATPASTPATPATPWSGASPLGRPGVSTASPASSPASSPPASSPPATPSATPPSSSPPGR
ncbi:hypothetical protein [Nannocystis sp.]|uniref:hypothetical protein n=1 Tax=Nannocystis sp. TaxID=1962667 RepID=UPI0025F4255F|nr:hypothetical protein [Nannocystis sp.]